MEVLAFDSRSHHLRVADQADGPGSRWPDSRAAGQATRGIAAINGGFFTPEGKPLGKVISDGRSVGSINRASSLGSGFFVEDPSGSMKLIRRDRFSAARQAIQSGPLLVENGRPVDGLSGDSSVARSLIATDGRNGWLLVRSGPCSLAGLAEALAGKELAGVRIQSALNLDGGRSSELWISAGIAGGPAFQRPFWNKPVRNFLVLSPRP